MAVRVVVNRGELQRLRSGSGMRTFLDDLGVQVAADATARAPKLTGAGAASIHGEVVDDGGGLAVHVSWDAEHDYLRFSELGDERQPARPFLRPAVGRRYSV